MIANHAHTSSRAVLAGVLLLAWGHAAGSRGETAAREAMRARGLEGPAMESIAGRFADAARRGLPRSPLRARLEEGLAKRADPEAIAAAVDRRLDALVRADVLLAGSDEGRRPHGVDADAGLLVLVQALESGVPEEAFEGLFRPGRGGLSPRMQAVVEAGELLHLAGVDGDAVTWFMRDSRDRNLRRMEAIRAARFWIRLHGEGVPGEEIRRRLWPERPAETRNDDVPRDQGPRRFRGGNGAPGGGRSPR